MRHFDRTAAWTAVAGVILMVAALSLNVNPADSSSVAPILRDSPIAFPVLLLFCVTCVPAIFVALMVTASVFTAPTNEMPAFLVMYWSVAIALQAMLYWIIGKVVGKAVRLSQRWMRNIVAPPNEASAADDS